MINNKKSSISLPTLIIHNNDTGTTQKYIIYAWCQYILSTHGYEMNTTVRTEDTYFMPTFFILCFYIICILLSLYILLCTAGYTYANFSTDILVR